jgi:hypothetical protein
MPTSYQKAPNAIHAMVEKAMEQYHPELVAAHVTIDTVIVDRFDKDEQSIRALKRSGYPIDAKIGVTSLQDRARGIADAKLMIDGLEWNKATDRQRVALIDHELEHLDLIPLKPTKKEPNRSGPKYDDLGRPCLRIRPHDWQLAGFKDVAERLLTSLRLLQSAPPDDLIATCYDIAGAPKPRRVDEEDGDGEAR